ncbi:amidohydrolase [Paenibacillus sp. S150]|nr:amidohydrolase [Paenibacillus sp. S150]
MELKQEIIALRREIHRNPELALEEYETASLAAKTLRELDIEVTEGIGTTGVVGLLRGGREGRTAALRADMDALPINEDNDHEYRSVKKNVMHACGHDAHTAMLLGAAKILAGLRGSLAGNVKFIFQPSEESSLGGAPDMIKEGVLHNPDVAAVFGMHAAPHLEAGTIGYREGPFYAAAGGFRIEILGNGGHGAEPHHAVDPILAAAELIQALQSIASSKVDPLEPFVLTVCTIHGGQALNVIADTLVLGGTVRAFSLELLHRAGGWIEKLAKSVTEAHGAGYRLTFTTGGGPLINDPELTAESALALTYFLGNDRVKEVPRLLLGEDFAYYSHIVPSVFFSLGTALQGAANYPLHHPKFDLDENALPVGAAVFAFLAVSYLSEG